MRGPLSAQHKVHYLTILAVENSSAKRWARENKRKSNRTTIAFQLPSHESVTHADVNILSKINLTVDTGKRIRASDSVSL